MRLAAAVISVFLWAFAAVAAQAQERSMIVLDGSGSMWGQIDGKAKIGIARETLGDVLGAVPEASELGLIVYGHRTKGDCGDIELAVPAAKGTSAAITAFANGISPKGKTPLSAAVRQAAEALKYTEDKATVILVTDGLETCEADPCALGRELEAAGVDFTAHVVGFGLSKEEGAQVACLAENTGGRYIEASNAETLGEALKETVVAVAEPEPASEPEPEPEPAAPEFNFIGTASLAEGGPMLEDGDLYWALRAPKADGTGGKAAAGGYAPRFEASVPPGDYVLQTKLGAINQHRPVTLSAGETTEMNVVLDVGIVAVKARRTPDGEIEGDIRVRLENGKFAVGAYGEGVFYVPAGEVTLIGRLARAETRESFALAAGERIEKEVIVGAGVLVATALYAEGGPDVETGDIRYTVYEAKTDLKGNRKQVQGTYGSKPMELPAGDYVVGARLDKAEVLSQPVSVEAGQRTDVQLVLGAGVAALTAPGGYRIKVFGKKNMQGERKQIAGDYGDAYSITLLAGTYLAQVTYESDKAPVEAEFTVTAGERVEVTLE